MGFGAIVKNLRKQSNMTQERLAELLSISPQAVSRWETDVAMPDISLLPPLANLFNVTTDYLLGMDSYARDLRKKEYEEAYFEYWKNEDKEGNYQIALKAVSEYPGNMEYLKWLADNEFYISFNRNEKERVEFLESAVHLYKMVLNNSNNRLYNETLHMLVLTLSNLKRLEEAKDYAMMQEDGGKRAELLCLCLEGEELLKHKQKLAFDKFISFKTYFCNENDISTHDALINIFHTLFPDGKFNYLYEELEYHHFMKCKLYCVKGDKENAITEFDNALLYAKKMMEYRKQNKFFFTSKYFDHLEGDVYHDKNFNDVEELISIISTDECFNIIRNNDKIKEILK